MNILILNTSERTGGAAVAANRLAHALTKAGLNVAMLVRDKKTDDPRVVSVNTSPLQKKLNFIRFVWERLIIFICNFLSKKNLFQVSIANTGTDISDHPLVKKADIIHIHWINQGFLSLHDIKKLIATGKPIVWTMHDLWPATAICHYPAECDRYIVKCRRCPMLKSKFGFDLASYVFNAKSKVGFSKITFVGCSRWIMEEACKGMLIKNAHFVSIPNPIDTSIFSFHEKGRARNHYNLPTNKYLLLFAAAKVSDLRKGALYFIKACNLLKAKYKDQIEIVLMGNSSNELLNEFPFKVNTLGYISNQASMSLAYACADMFIIPSLEDNLPNTIMEAMASGTPCVGFKTGGIPEMIDHKINGYIAEHRDTEDLARGIEWVLENNKTLGLSEACLEKVKKNYSENIVAKQYISLYQSLIK